MHKHDPSPTRCFVLMREIIRLKCSQVRVQVFQGEVFKRFLDGGDLEECYQSVAAVANLWLDVLVSEKHTCGDTVAKRMYVRKHASSGANSCGDACISVLASEVVVGAL
jgi:hypothetical protein